METDGGAIIHETVLLGVVEFGNILSFLHEQGSGAMCTLTPWNEHTPLQSAPAPARKKNDPGSSHPFLPEVTGFQKIDHPKRESGQSSPSRSERKRKQEQKGGHLLILVTREVPASESTRLLPPFRLTSICLSGTTTRATERQSENDCVTRG